MLKQVSTQEVKNLPAMPETWVQFLGQEDPLEKEMATHSSILAWRIPWTEEPGGLQSVGSQSLAGYSPCSRKKLDTTEQLARKRGQRRSVGLRKRREGHGLHTGEETLSEKRTTDPENTFGSACVCVCFLFPFYSQN